MKSMKKQCKSTVTGNLGTSPITDSVIAGSSCEELNGKTQMVNVSGSTGKITDATLPGVTSNFLQEDRLHWSSQLNLQNLEIHPVLVSNT